MAFFVKSAIALGLPPFVLALLVSAASFYALKRNWQGLGNFLSALAVAIGYSVGHRVATGSLPLVPRSVEDWLPLLAFVASLLSVLENSPKVNEPIRFSLRSVFCLLAASVLLLPSASLSLPVKFGWALGLGVTFGVVWTGFAQLANRGGDATLPFSLSLVATINSAALLISHSAALSQLSGVLAAVAAAVFISCLFGKQKAMLSGAGGVLVSLLFGANVSGMFYADLPVPSAIFLWLAPLAGWVRFLPFLQNLPRWSQVASQLAAVVLLSTLGLGIAIYKHGLPTGGY